MSLAIAILTIGLFGPKLYLNAPIAGKPNAIVALSFGLLIH